MSDMPTQTIPAPYQPSRLNRIQRFFEDWWPVMAIALAAIMVGLVVTLVVHSPGPAENQFCEKVHGRWVQTGVGDQLACVDDGWKLVTP